MTFLKFKIKRWHSQRHHEVSPHCFHSSHCNKGSAPATPAWIHGPCLAACSPAPVLCCLTLSSGTWHSLPWKAFLHCPHNRPKQPLLVWDLTRHYIFRGAHLEHLLQAGYPSSQFTQPVMVRWCVCMVTPFLYTSSSSSLKNTSSLLLDPIPGKLFPGTQQSQ